MKKLAAIYNVWDATELLHFSIKSIYDRVDLIIIVYQTLSNFGEQKKIIKAWDYLLERCSTVGDKIIIKDYNNSEVQNGTLNETMKRNIGLNLARMHYCTHFLFMDCDEIYQDLGKAKQQYIDSGHEGSVAQMYTYFKKPTLRLKDVDNYYVPFIHRLRDDTVAGLQPYPYYVDPTRRVNCNDVVLIEEKMHHFSWVRRDIEMKVRNSSARANIEKSQLLADYHNPVCGPGYFLKDYGQELIEVENLFNIEI